MNTYARTLSHEVIHIETCGVHARTCYTPVQHTPTCTHTDLVALTKKILEGCAYAERTGTCRNTRRYTWVHLFDANKKTDMCTYKLDVNTYPHTHNRGL